MHRSVSFVGQLHRISQGNYCAACVAFCGLPEPVLNITSFGEVSNMRQTEREKICVINA